jgi:nicotinamidase-related amidase
MQHRVARRSLLALTAASALPGAGRVSARHLQQATPVTVTRAPLVPGATALLVMDFQDAWLATLADPDVVVAQAAAAIGWAREHEIEVAYARVTFTTADYAAVPEQNVIFNQIARPPGALDADAPGNDIDERVAPAWTDKVVHKTRVSAFQRTDLDAWLRGMGIDTLILAGISTSGVVLSTVCDGADLDYRLVVLADACADRDPTIQQVLMEQVFPQRATVTTVAGLPELFWPT